MQKPQWVAAIADTRNVIFVDRTSKHDDPTVVIQYSLIGDNVASMTLQSLPKKEVNRQRFANSVRSEPTASGRATLVGFAGTA